jgi:hypothetical protein
MSASPTRGLPADRMPTPVKSDPGGAHNRPLGGDAGLAQRPSASEPHTRSLPRNPNRFIEGWRRWLATFRRKNRFFGDDRRRIATRDPTGGRPGRED